MLFCCFFTLTAKFVKPTNPLVRALTLSLLPLHVTVQKQYCYQFQGVTNDVTNELQMSYK